MKKLGHYEQSLQCAEDTLNRIRRVMGNHPLIMLPAHCLATCLRELGQSERARELGEDTVTRCRQVLGDDHPETLRAAHSLATTRRGLEQARQLGEDP